MTRRGASQVTTLSLTRHEPGHGTWADLTGIHTSSTAGGEAPAKVEVLRVAESSHGWRVEAGLEMDLPLFGAERTLHAFASIVLITSPDGRTEALITSAMSARPLASVGQRLGIDVLLGDPDADNADPEGSAPAVSPEVTAIVVDGLWRRVERLHTLACDTGWDRPPFSSGEQWRRAASAILWAGFPSAQAATPWVPLFSNLPERAAGYFAAGLAPDDAHGWLQGRVDADQVSCWTAQGWTGAQAQEFEAALRAMELAQPGLRDRARRRWFWRHAARDSGQCPQRVLDAVRAGLAEAEFDQVCDSGNWDSVATLAALVA